MFSSWKQKPRKRAHHIEEGTFTRLIVFSNDLYSQRRVPYILSASTDERQCDSTCTYIVVLRNE